MKERKILKKYEITEEQLNKEIDHLSLGKVCDVNCLLCITELLTKGDVQDEQ